MVVIDLTDFECELDIFTLKIAPGEWIDYDFWIEYRLTIYILPIITLVASVLTLRLIEIRIDVMILRRYANKGHDLTTKGIKHYSKKTETLRDKIKSMVS